MLNYLRVFRETQKSPKIYNYATMNWPNNLEVYTLGYMPIASVGSTDFLSYFNGLDRGSCLHFCWRTRLRWNLRPQKMSQIGAMAMFGTGVIVRKDCDREAT